ncbi:ricin-type beta-trefoil lectin domain protein [Streptomyces goshikiensis]|uniref:ricin-type beta-trefoil lectin domain protein n=1 Tax=Streptomyces goshikiensis TaxID=1942 RepID=UPI0036B0557C
MSPERWPVRTIAFHQSRRNTEGFVPRLRLLLGILLTFALAATALTTPVDEARAAALLRSRPFSDYRPLTWNMQGSDVDGVKWRTVGALVSGAPATGAHNIVALQEAGTERSLPRKKKPIRTYNSRELTGREDGRYRLNVYEWNYTNSMKQTQKLYLYFMDTDSDSEDRKNLAIVTDKLAERPVFIARQKLSDSNTLGNRPSLGLKFSTPGFAPDFFFNVHATAGGGEINDASNILTAINTSPEVPAGSQWAALGDYNLVPASLVIPPGSSLSRTYTATRQGGGEINLMVSRTPNAQHGWPARTLLAGSTESDHWPVEFQTASGRRGHSTLRTREHPENCLTAVKDDDAPMTRCDGSAAQNWQLIGNLVVNTKFGNMCLDVRRGWTGAGTRVESYTCHGQGNQQWEYKSDGTLAGVASGRCLDTSGESGKLIIQECNAHAPNQQWILPSDQSTQRIQVNKDGTVNVVPVSPSGKDGTAKNIGGQALSIGTAIHNIAHPEVIDVFAIDKNRPKLTEASYDAHQGKLVRAWSEFKTDDGKPVPLETLTDLSVTMNAESTYVAVTGGKVGSGAEVCVARIRRTGTESRTTPWTTPWKCSPAHGVRVAAVQVPRSPYEFDSKVSERDLGDSVYIFTYGGDSGKIYGREISYRAHQNRLYDAMLSHRTLKDVSRSQRSIRNTLIALPSLPKGVSQLVATLSGTVVHLTATTMDEGNNTYLLTMDTQSDTWRPEWQQVGTHMAAPTVSDTPGELMICGAMTDKKTGCANKETTGDYKSEQKDKKFKKTESPEHLTTPTAGLSVWAWLGIALAIAVAIIVVAVLVVNFYAAPAVLGAAFEAFAELGGAIGAETAAGAAEAGAVGAEAGAVGAEAGAVGAEAGAAGAEAGAAGAEGTLVTEESVGTSILRVPKWPVKTLMGFRTTPMYSYGTFV